MYLEHQWEKYMLTSKRTILKEYSITHLKLIKRMFSIRQHRKENMAANFKEIKS